MSKVKIQGHASGTGVFTLTSPNSGTDRTITLPDGTGTLAFTTGDDDKLPLAGGAMTGLLSNTLNVARNANQIRSNATNLLIENTHASGAAGLRLKGGNGEASIIYGENNATDKLYFMPRNDTGKQVVIDHVGKVGIGTASPAYALHIDTTTQGSRLLLENTANGNTGIFMRVKNSGSQVGNSTIRQENNGDISIFQGTSSEALRATFKQGGGICFNSDTATANALNDYEEGTWTPTAATGASGLTKVDCHYTKIGNMVHLQGRVYDFTGINSSTLAIGGLPFNPQYSSSNGVASTTFVRLDQGYQLWMHLGHAEPKIYFRYQKDNAQYESLSGSDISGSSNIHFNATYITAS